MVGGWWLAVRRSPLTSIQHSQELYHSERGDRIDRRPRSSPYRKRRHLQHEFPAIPRGRRRCERLEVAVVEQRYAKADEREVVHGVGHFGRRRVHSLRVIAAEDGDVALLQPGD